jgi:copper oxidase (laccase) domain-containing protein
LDRREEWVNLSDVHVSSIIAIDASRTFANFHAYVFPQARGTGAERALVGVCATADADCTPAVYADTGINTSTRLLTIASGKQRLS